MSKQYFGEEVDKAIVKFQKSEDKSERESLCKDIIIPAFEKLASYHYHRVSIIKNEEVMHDCVIDLYEKIPMFDSEKYVRSFPYFNMIARNFFYQKFKSEKKEINKEEIVSFSQDANILLNDNLLEDDIEVEIEKKEFLNIFIEQLPKWRERTEKEQEKEVIDALIVLFQNADNLDIYKKKAIFIYLRELLEEKMNSKQIALNLNKVKKRFQNLKRKYQRGDI